MTNENSSTWEGWSGYVSHPNAPAGGGGLGYFRNAGPLLDPYTLPGRYSSCFITSSQSAQGPMLSNDPPYLPSPSSPAARWMSDSYSATSSTDSTFSVRDIPRVMRDQLNWTKSAELMEAWFSKPARIMTQAEKEGRVEATEIPKDYVNTTLFSMKWILAFTNADSARKDLLSKLSTEMALKQLRSIGTKLPDGKGVADTSNVLLLHSLYQFQYSSVEYNGKMNDLYGSLGRFSLYAAILEWTITRESGNSAGRIMNVSKIGIYMRDTFDFLGKQYLGHWNKKGVGILPAAALNNKLDDSEWHLRGWSPSLGWATPINNSDFNTWREKNNMGGDLLIFSDVLPRAVSINVPC